MAETSRRVVLTGAGVAGVTAALSACGGEPETQPGGSPEQPDTPSANPDGGGDPLAKVDDVPVGGGVVLAGEKVVLTQPTEGEIHGFSSVCTHRGCTISSVSDGTINCKCHGSKFSAEDGSVRNGPATRPLPKVEVELDGETVVRA